MLLTKPIPVIRNSYPLLSDSSIRRLERQSIIPQRCRNQVTGLDGPMDSARLGLRGQQRFPIRLSLLQHPKRSFRKVAGDRHLGAVVTASGFYPLVKLADVFVATAFGIEERAVSGFNKGPLQINIDIAAYGSVSKFSPAGVLARHQATIARQLLGTTKPLDTTDLGPDYYRQDLPHSRKALQQGDLRARGKDLDHVRFDGSEILDHVVELIEDALERSSGMKGELSRQFLDDLPASFAEGIADLVHHIAVLTQSCMHTVLQLRSLPAEHHASARQFTRISNCTRSNPYRGQGPRSLQPVQPFGVKFIALVDAALHQFGQTCVDQLRLSAARFDLIDYPVPVAHRLDCHRRTGSPSLNEVLYAPTAMSQPTCIQLSAFTVLHSCPGVMLVNVQCNVFHIVSPPRSSLLSTAVTVYIAFIIIRVTWTSSEASLRTWIPAIHAGMTKFEFFILLGECRIMKHFVVKKYFHSKLLSAKETMPWLIVQRRRQNQE